MNRTFKDFLKQQEAGMSALANAGVIGLHMVSGPLVGFGLGYGLDYLLGTHPWFKIIFLLVGIAAGFLNVYRDSRLLLQRLSRSDRPAPGTGSRSEDGSGDDAGTVSRQER